MASKLYVGNLPFRITEEAISDAFGQYGTVVSVMIMTDRMSGRSRGFGFVEMADDQAAQSCIDNLHGKELEGRELVVNMARPKRDDRGGNDRGNNRGGFNRNR